MAAEMSTGVLAMNQVWGRTPKVSMLVTAMDSRFFKKARNLTLFTCTDGLAIKKAIEAAIDTGEGQQVTVQTEGRDAAGALVASFRFEWSFKARP